MKSLSIYIHIPFCVQKCVYCDFLSAPADDEIKKKYLDALIREIREEGCAYSDYSVSTVFFGGGTPSILPGIYIEEIINTLKANFTFDEDAEISLEMNPKTATMEKMEIFVRAGINRLSIGLQSANDNELKMLGRIHTYEDFLNTFKLARECGIRNINVDLMSAIPGQSFDSFMDTLKKVIELSPEHVSAYSLIIEENTYLYDNLSSFPKLPSEEEDRRIYQATKEVLKEAGYERYEISNYSKPGFECRHNKVYWERKDYAGFGLGAASMVDNKRWKNIEDLTRYIDKCEKIEIEELDVNAQIEEFMFLGLREMKGVSKELFKSTFGKNINDVYEDTIKKWTKLGLLVEDEDRIFFSDQGIDVSNQILSEFIF